MVLGFAGDVLYTVKQADAPEKPEGCPSTTPPHPGPRPPPEVPQFPWHRVRRNPGMKGLLCSSPDTAHVGPRQPHWGSPPIPAAKGQKALPPPWPF